MSLTSMVAAATEHSAGPNLNPWVVGAGVFVLLLVLLGALLSFGGGRDHS